MVSYSTGLVQAQIHWFWGVCMFIYQLFGLAQVGLHSPLPEYGIGLVGYGGTSF